MVAIKPINPGPMANDMASASILASSMPKIGII